MQNEKSVPTEVLISKWVDQAWRPALGAMVAVVILGGIYLAFSTYQQSQEVKAQEKLFALQKKIEVKTTELNKAQEAAKKSKDKKIAEKSKKNSDAPAITKNPETLNKHYGEILSEIENFINQEKGKKASFMAAIQISALATEHNDLERAERILNEVLPTVSDRDLFAGLLRLQLGTVQMDLKKYSEAAAIFEKVTKVESFTSFHPHALLRLGICYLESGDLSKAESAFSRLEQDHPLTSAANEAKDYKKLVLLKKGA